MDRLSPRDRSELMGRIRGKDTVPEMVVRRLVHELGYRFRLHRRDLPGTPDLVFPRHGKIILVHGCFWHRHRCSKGRSLPVTNEDRWQRKFKRNVARDCSVRRDLHRLGWDVLVVWECQTSLSKRDLLKKRLINFLES